MLKKLVGCFPSPDLKFIEIEQYFPIVVLFTKANNPIYELSNNLEFVNLENGKTLLDFEIYDPFL